MHNWYWELLAGVAGACIYYLLRYSPDASCKVPNPHAFTVYLRKESQWLFKGIATFAVTWALWEYAGEWILGTAREIITPLKQTTFQVPPMSVPIAAVLGFASKKLYDILPKLWTILGKILSRFAKVDNPA